MKKFKLFIIIIANLFIISGVSAARLDIKDGTTNDPKNIHPNQTERYKIIQTT
jgi:hypothetical protein